MQDHNNILSQYLKRSAAIVAAFMIFSFTTSGHTSVITSGCSEAASCTLEELFAGGSLTVNDKVFENWSPGPNELDSDFSQIVVTGLDDGGNDPGPGLRYDLNGQASYIGAEFADDWWTTFFYFEVATSDGSAKINGASLTIIDFQLFDGRGGVEIVEYGRNFRGTLSVPNIYDPPPLYDSTSFDSQSRIQIETELRIYAFQQFAGGSIDSFEQRFSQTVIPIPPALWLFGSGLLGLVGMARCKKTA